MTSVELAKILDMPIDQIEVALKGLEEKGLVEVETDMIPEINNNPVKKGPIDNNDSGA